MGTRISVNESNWQSDLARAQQWFDENRLEDALASANRVLSALPRSAETLEIIGLVQSRRHQVHDAIETLERALHSRCDLVAAHNYLGLQYSYAGDVKRALQHFEQTLIIEPMHVHARFNRALALLKLGRFREGWLEYEWRWKSTGMARPSIPLPRWDGSPLDGRSILIHTEQGLGDTIQFVRFLPEIKRLGATVWFACQKPLAKLLAGIQGVDHWMPIDQPAPIAFDLYSPLMSLPALLGLDRSEQYQVPAPYLAADSTRIETWRDRLQRLPGLKIGIGWQGSPTLIGDVWRSVSLKHFAPLANREGITLVSLQKHDAADHLAKENLSFPLITWDGLDNDGAFVDTVAIMQHLDLVITVDTALAHVAGAAGVPVWTLLSTASDWRWGIIGRDTPWYKSMRLFRQEKLGEWENVFTELASILLTYGGRTWIDDEST